MVDAVSFRTRARTIDHLGREQIADCPTAVSELWKNAYDAYATSVALHIYDGNVPMAAIVDDGHGMNRAEFIDKWLVVGTESKASNEKTPEADRNGLPLRPKQGQKGIGRLSSAFLGPLLLVVSKRRSDRFTAALIDWRLFENPFLFLQDIEIPVVEFDLKEEIFAQLPGMFEELRGNLRGNGKNEGRDIRVNAAWKSFDEMEAVNNRPSTRSAMEKAVDNATFEPRHFAQWPLWREESAHGTILLIADIIFDLEAHLEARVHTEDADAAKQAKDRLFQTLSNFIDPFCDPTEINQGYGVEKFTSSVTAWTGLLHNSVVSNQREFTYRNLEDLEHVVEGAVDENGFFTGRVKAFGRWLEDKICIPPKSAVSPRENSKVGPFYIRLGTFQSNPGSSTHPPEIHRHLLEQVDKYSGIMVYRNGLRVMPYGREDNDFFEIEKRRSMHAGRYFWSNRRTFGRVAITRDDNYNLKDKAGREGLIDNKAAKVFRDLVENILIKTAYDYFGTDSELQKQYLPEIQEARAKERAEEERKKQRATKRKRFRGNLKRLASKLDDLLQESVALADQVNSSDLSTEELISVFRDNLKVVKDHSKYFSLGEAPKNLGTLEDEYVEYRSKQRRINELVSNLEQSLSVALEAVKPRVPREIAFSDLSSHAAYLQSRLRNWMKEIRALLDEEMQRINVLYEERSKLYHARTLPLLDDIEHHRLPLAKVLTRLVDEREKIDFENSETFEPYIAALQSLQESIDLESLATYGMDQIDEMREEIDRLYSLAQLGITVEIIGHEIEGLDLTISEGLDELPDSVKQSDTFRAVKTAHEALTERLRFLSPLKLSGPKFRTDLTGSEILRYAKRFFGNSLEVNNVRLEATERFLKFSVYEQPSRIYPVFLNLINNAAYWVRQTPNGTNLVLLDTVEEKVVVADDGPGVDERDQKHLFSLFFSRKIRGGRGVGLYLSRANLAAGGHTITYATGVPFKVLSGANFVIEFKGAKYE
ncbi:MAG: ATP-binding protein [Pseudogulbenkiania sp.]|nr:ATP-binding protein [Pseudogulbenkiania sp.]